MLSEQLVEQAKTIASLTAQRDLLITQHRDTYSSWEAERQGWDRSAERLIAQRSAAMALSKEEVSSSLRVPVLSGVLFVSIHIHSIQFSFRFLARS